ncbi:DNA primase [Risungbinella massiliensis]|uniref:DNA primase n=1 Tax=Risungbinella massiliensis TaxID=1329796 RepID=UPI0005CC215D|nr:DNA primase [Risungbinella massiliensis]
MGDHHFEEAVEQVRKQTDILEVIGRYVTLKKSGKNYFGLCPFHSEKTPSFSVTPDRQIFHCFGCGQGGDVIKFIMEIEQFTFGEAVRNLAGQIGVTVPNTATNRDDREEEEIHTIRQAMELSAQLYHHLLLHTEHGEPAREYLAKRQITEETIREFQIGFAPRFPQFLLNFLTTRRGYSIPILLKAGLISPSTRSKDQHIDRFRGRLMIPIHDTQGRVIAFGGRLLGEGQPKYLNSPESRLFQKRHHLFNFHRARATMRKQKEAVLFEGFLDVISAWQEGIHHVVATMGTSLSEDHARFMRRNVETAIVCYDGDRAGQDAAEKASQLLHSVDCTVKVAMLPHGIDPDDYLKKHGAATFRGDILAGSLSYYSFRLERLKRNFSLQDETGRLRYLYQAVQMIGEIPLPIERDHYLQKLAEEFHVPLSTLKDQLSRIKGKKQSRNTRDKEKEQWNNGYYVNRKRKHPPLPQKNRVERSEMFLIAYMLRDKGIAEWVKKELGAEFTTDIYAALAAYLFSYYERGYDADPVRFLHYMGESELSSVVSELLTREIPEPVSEKELQEYVANIRRERLVQEILQKEAEVNRLGMIDPLRAAELLQECNELRIRLKNNDFGSF